jgi:hypothetical protein
VGVSGRYEFGRLVLPSQQEAKRGPGSIRRYGRLCRCDLFHVPDRQHHHGGYLGAELDSQIRHLETFLMFTLVLPAKNIPDDTEVRKVTGQVVYRLLKEVKIFGPADVPPEKQKMVITEPDMNYLCGERSINMIHDSLKLAVDFKSLEDMHEFIEESLNHSGDGCGE